MKFKSIAALLLIVFVVAACKTEKKETDQPKKTDSTVVKDTTKKEEPAKEEPKITSSFKFTTTPAFEMIPDEPVQGAANGKQFNPQYITIEPKFNQWYIIFYEKPLESPTSMFPEGQYLNVELPFAPKAGTKITKTLASDGWWQMTSADDKNSTTSLNATNAYVVEFTSWELKPWDKKGENVQIAGKASGKIAVCYQGFSDYKDSWVAGTFKDVPIRYNGKPEIKKVDKEKAKNYK